jgi:predicted DNA-binding transcriptional regulator AlpA
MDKLLTTKELLSLLGDVPRSTFYRWRSLGLGPKSMRLPNGEIRYRPTEVNRWLADLERVSA